MVQLRNSQCSRCAFILIVISVFISIAYYSYLVKDKTIVVSEQVEVEPLDFLKKVRIMEIDFWNEIRVETMSPELLIEYFKWSNSTSCVEVNYFGGYVLFYNPRGMDGIQCVWTQ